MEVLDGLLEAVATDEPHGVIRPAVAVGPQAVDRHDAGMLQPAGDLGLDEEPLAAGRVVGVMVEDLLERHLAVQLTVQRHEDRAQAAAGMRPQDAEPLAVGWWPCRRRSWPCGRRSSSVEPWLDGRGRAWPPMSASPRLSQALAGGAAGGDGGQTPLDVAAVLLDVACHQGLDGGAVVGIEVAASDQVVGQGAGLVEGPGLEGGDELDLVDQPVLQCKQAEQQVAFSGDGGHGEAPGRDAASDPAGDSAGARARGRRVGRIIAHASVACISADPVPIAPGRSAGSRGRGREGHCSFSGESA